MKFLRIFLFVLLAICIVLYGFIFVISFLVPGNNLYFTLIDGLLFLAPTIILILNIKIINKILLFLSFIIPIGLLIILPLIINSFED